MEKKSLKYRFLFPPNWTNQIVWKGENGKKLLLNDTIEVTVADQKNKTLADTLSKYFVAVVAVESDSIKLVDKKDVKEKMKEKKYDNN